MDGAAIPKSLLRRELLAEPAHFRPDDDGRNTPLLFTPQTWGRDGVGGGSSLLLQRNRAFPDYFSLCLPFDPSRLDLQDGETQKITGSDSSRELPLKSPPRCSCFLEPL